MQVRRFGPVSEFVRFPERPVTHRGAMVFAVVAGSAVGGTLAAVGHAWAAAGCGLGMLGGLELWRTVRHWRAHRAWRRWARDFVQGVPRLMEELQQLPTPQRLYAAGRAVGDRLLDEAVPEVPVQTVPGAYEPQRRLLWWVSTQCHGAPSPFLRGLRAAWDARDW